MKFKIYLVLALVLILIVFVLQNTEEVNFTFLLFSFKISQVLLLFLTFALGLIIGILLPDFLKKRENEKNTSEEN